MALTSLIQQGSSRVGNKIFKNIPGVIKLIQDWLECKMKSEYCKRSKGGNMNGTCNTSKINIEITQSAIA